VESITNLLCAISISIFPNQAASVGWAMRESTAEEEEEELQDPVPDQECRPQRHHPLAMDPLAAWATWRAVAVREEPPPWAMWWAGWSRFCPHPNQKKKSKNVIRIDVNYLLAHTRHTVYYTPQKNIPAPPKLLCCIHPPDSSVAPEVLRCGQSNISSRDPSE